MSLVGMVMDPDVIPEALRAKDTPLRDKDTVRTVEPCRKANSCVLPAAALDRFIVTFPVKEDVN